MFYYTWIALQTAVFSFGLVSQYLNQDLRVLNQIGASVLLSRGAGLCLAVTNFFVILPMCKKSMSLLSTYFTKLPEILQKLHITAVYTIVFFSIIHSVSHYINFYVIDQNKIINSTMITIHYYTIAGITGHIMVCSLIVITVFSTSELLKRNYDAFITIHTFYLIYLGASIAHGLGCFVKGVSGVCYPYYSSVFTGIPLAMFLYERIYRMVAVPEVSTTSVQLYKDGVKLEIKRTFKYLPGQYLYVNFPQIDKIHWHPITISTCELLSPEVIGLCIKDVGDWSSKVREFCNNQGDVTDPSGGSFQIKLKVDGPYFSPCNRHIEFDNIIFVCSGIGITPFLSIIKDFAMKYMTTEHMFIFNKKIDIYWVSRNRDDIIWFEEIFSDLAYIIPSSNLNIKVYITDPVTDIEQVRDLSLGRNPKFDNLSDSKVLINYMRPDLAKEFLNYSTSVRDAKVGVFVCANEGLTDEVIKNCKKFSNKNVNFEYIVENF
jgi:NADPH oxidase 1